MNPQSAGAHAREERAPAQAPEPMSHERKAELKAAALAACAKPLQRVNGHAPDSAPIAKPIMTEAQRLLEIERRRREAAALAEALPQPKE